MFKYTIFSAALVGLLAANLFRWQEPILGVVLTLIYFLYFGHRLGAVFLPKFSHFWHRLFGPFFLLAGLAVLGSLIYYFYALPDWLILALLAVLPLGLIPYCRFFKKKIDEWPSGQLEAVPLVEPNTRPANRWAWLVLLGDGCLFYYLFSHATTQAIRSPWELVSYKFFLVFFLLTFCLILFVRKTESSILSVFTIFVHCLLLLSVALLIYKLGYGFDPILHQAAEKYIARFGAILPKTAYYLGQYVLVVLLSKMTVLPIGLWDRALLPVLEALLLPPLIFLVLRHGLEQERRDARLASLFFFLIPFGSMIATTPQDLANFFALTAILFGCLFLTSRLVSWRPALLLTLAALAAHPLTGLPLLVFFVLMILIKHCHSPIKSGNQVGLSAAVILIAVFSLFLLPAVFVLFAKAGFHWPTLEQVLAFLPFSLPQKRPDQPFSLGFTLLYFYDYFLPLLILIVSALGGYFLFKKPAYRPIIFLSLISYFIFFVNAAWLKFSLTFPNIIDFEQGQYAGRLYHFSFFLFLPLFLYGLIYLINRVIIWSRRPFSFPGLSNFISLSLYLLTALLLTASFYLSYPRVDAYSFSRYLNTSALDIQAVHLIAEKAAGHDYLVLGNTSFSAAAIKEFGFAKYFKTPLGDVFYYALPTGGPLYGYYQKMVYQGASRETMEQAMDLTGVSQAFLVLHDYWNSFKTAAPQAKQTADEWWEVAGEKMLVFRYKTLNYEME